MALAGGPHVIAYRASGLRENDAFWRCFQEALGILINPLAVKFTYSQMFGRSDLAVALGTIGWSYGDLIFTKIIPLWTGTRQLEFDWAYIALSLDANFELIFNFAIFLAPWLLMRKEKNVLAACTAILIFILSCFHLSIFGLIEQQIQNIFYAIIAKVIFTVVIGVIGLMLKATWIVEAPYEPKKKTEEGFSFFGLIGKFGNFCLQTIRNAVTNAPSTVSGIEIHTLNS
ncbi:hypothetical protein ACTXT7_003296 [Hymenolepis weldensis]